MSNDGEHGLRDRRRPQAHARVVAARGHDIDRICRRCRWCLPGTWMLEVGLSVRCAMTFLTGGDAASTPPAWLLRKPAGVSSSRCFAAALPSRPACRLRSPPPSRPLMLMRGVGDVRVQSNRTPAHQSRRHPPLATTVTRAPIEIARTTHFPDQLPRARRLRAGVRTEERILVKRMPDSTRLGASATRPDSGNRRCARRGARRDSGAQSRPRRSASPSSRADERPPPR